MQLWMNSRLTQPKLLYMRCLRTSFRRARFGVHPKSRTSDGFGGSSQPHEVGLSKVKVSSNRAKLANIISRVTDGATVNARPTGPHLLTTNMLCCIFILRRGLVLQPDETEFKR